ncbi:serendipity locus protein alpha-like [Wyeomyia smithii]|uniref:serendipity locus protein alpha-like n=1 Tax=Wyeomyia smithii TaxID=174621 RepID=UPI002467AFAB|nr:serendipity locus protein alpha-like [Wyeomyia smithii]
MIICMAGVAIVGFQLKMIPELQEILQLIQEKLYRGYMCSKQSGIDWLNTVCGDFFKLFRVLHKFIVFEACNNVGVMKITFLCLSQIVVCIRCLEQTLMVECEKQCVLSSTRQCFLDRIVWCMAKLKALSEDSDSVERENTMESNFVNFLDLALSLVEPLTVAFESKHEINQAQQDAEAMMETAKIRSVVEALVAQTLSFGNVLNAKERTQLMGASQKVLKECISLEKESALVEGEDKPNAQSRLLKASALESAIFQLEAQVNDCLLRLVYDTFAELNQNLIGDMRSLVKNEAPEEDISSATDKFDSLVDKMMQIGLFAISYADNYKVASTIRSCLASIEALDSYLVPSIFVPCNHHSKLLEEHWSAELSMLRYHVQRIIDSNAFALALVEILDCGIDSLLCSFNVTEALTLIRQAEVFREHLEFNFSDLKLAEEPLKIHFEDFKTMVLECRAIVKCFKEDPTIDTDRILKRFRIMLIKLKKIQQTISVGKSKDASTAHTSEVQLLIPDLARTDEEKAVEQSVKDFFSSTIPRPSMTSILYRSRRGQGRSRQGSIASLGELKSFSDVTAQLRQRAETTPEKSVAGVAAGACSSRKRRNSLRVAIFKRKHNKQTAEFFDSFRSEIDFQITEILDQLNDLSTTFSQNEHVEPDTPTSNVTEEKPVTKKSITKEEIAILDDNRICINITTDI